MAGNQVVLTFAGDIGNLPRVSNQAADAVEQVGTSATSASDDLNNAGRSADMTSDRMGNLGSSITGLTDGLDSLAGASQALVDVQNYSRDRAMKLARAQADVEQAMLDGQQAAIDLEQATVDLNQAQADGRQAGIDLEQSQVDIKQANLDAATALKDYNAAVKEFGAGSDEARQAQIDLTQANLDEKQAIEDGNQARIDANQALVDGKQYALDGTQAVRDAKDAQLNLNDAMHEANPSALSEFSNAIGVVTPLLSGLVGVIGLMTAAQISLNLAFLASPITWIIVGVTAIIAVIVLIATKTDWFQRAWKNSWKWIKDAAKNTMDWIKGIPAATANIFSKVADFITKPYKAAFNMIKSAWNSTVGGFGFTVPGWIPGIGGNSFRIPKLHAGGTVPGVVGSEVLTILQAGEKVSSIASRGGGEPVLLGSDGSQLGDLLIDLIAKSMKRRGGDPEAMGIRI